MKVFIIIPAYNEEKMIASILSQIQKEGYRNIIVVDDGSDDGTYLKARDEKVIVLRHVINRGSGAATKTGIEAAKLLNAQIVVTIDADGQHNPQEIRYLVEKIDEGYDIALGSRTINQKSMPFFKKVANLLSNFFTFVIYGIWVSDSLSGFRAYSKKALLLINIQHDHYEYVNEIIQEIGRHKLKYCEVPVETRYSQYSKTKANRLTFTKGLSMLFKMIFST